MAKAKTQYVCQSCGARFPRWMGKCESCSEWSTLVEEIVTPEPKIRPSRKEAVGGHPQPIVRVNAAEDVRLQTGVQELDRVLGGGIVPGSVVLLGGDPGIGKSTLMMQVCAHPGGDRPVLFASGEESLKQLKLRADRLHITSERFLVISETDVEEILRAIGEVQPAFVVIDSIQTMFHSELESAPGSISQVRECTAALLRYAKQTGVPIFIIGHVTKDGVIAGPRVLEHMVDTVLQFEGDQHHAYRIVRGIKNRFGSTNEIGIFEMRESGLREIANPSEVFLSERSRGTSGSCVCASIEGTRALLIEVQALVSPSNFGLPQRTVSGLDPKRLALLLAVLEKRAGIRTGQFDVFVSIAGGVKIDEPAIDLAAAAAIVSSVQDTAIDHATAVVGEVGLGGEVRSVSHIEKRIGEAEKLGFQRILLPKGNLRDRYRSTSRLVEVESLADAIRKILA